MRLTKAVVTCTLSSSVIFTTAPCIHQLGCSATCAGYRWSTRESEVMLVASCAVTKGVAASTCAWTVPVTVPFDAL